jgi:hypothetical protein
MSSMRPGTCNAKKKRGLTDKQTKGKKTETGLLLYQLEL